MSNADLDTWIKFIGNKLKVNKHGKFGTPPYIKTNDDFTHLINVMVGTSILDKGASLISQFMITVLEKASSNKYKFKQRIDWFESDDFKDAVKKPFETGIGKQYAPQLDKIFKLNSSDTDWDWRNALTLGIKNPDQCFEGIEEDKKWFDDNKKPLNLTVTNGPRNRTSILNKQGSKICYICGFTLHQGGNPKQSTMECEHILPVVSAIQHLWLAAGNVTNIPSTDLHLEYDWAHSCCNGIKSNREFLKFKKKKSKYKVDEEQIKDTLDKIKEDALKYEKQQRKSGRASGDCHVISTDFGSPPSPTKIENKLDKKWKEKRVKEIGTRVKGIRKTINQRIRDISAKDNMDYYQILCQIKLLCCMLTDDNIPRRDRLTKVLTIAMSNKDKEKKKTRRNK